MSFFKKETYKVESTAEEKAQQELQRQLKEMEKIRQRKLELERRAKRQTKLDRDNAKLAKKLRSLQNEIEGLQKKHHEVSKNTQQASQEVSIIQAQLQKRKQEFEQVSCAIREKQQQAQVLSEHLEQEHTNLCQAIEVSSTALGLSKKVAQQTNKSLAKFSVASKDAEIMQTNIEETSKKLQGLDNFVSALTSNPNMGAMAVITMKALSNQGYELKTIDSEEGLLAYFNNAEKNHQIAIRLQSSSSIKAQERWELETELFNRSDEGCLDICDQLEVELENQGAIQEQRNITFPKKDGEGLPIDRSKSFKAYSNFQQHQIYEKG